MEKARGGGATGLDDIIKHFFVRSRLLLPQLGPAEVVVGDRLGNALPEAF